MRILVFVVSVFLSSLPCFGDDLSTTGSVPKKAVLSSNVIGLEGLGRAFLYSVFYERALFTQKLSFGLGFSYLGSGENKRSATLALPMYANYRFTTSPHAAYATAGFMNYNFSSDNQQARVMGSFPTAGIGWDYRSRSNYVFRATAYVFALVGPLPFVFPWVGSSVAKTF